jgi:acetyltransferase-like isoleucine patch superfamily enzyme
LTVNVFVFARAIVRWLIIRRAVRHGLRIGKNVRITRRPYFGGEPYLISIGNHVTISFNVQFINHDGATWVFRDRPEFKGLQRFGRIDIFDNVFIGANTTILPGVTIGPNAVVGAGSVVTKSLPANGVYAGVPATFVCSLDDYIERSTARCTYYPPEVASNLSRLRRVLMQQFPPPDPEAEPASPIDEVIERASRQLSDGSAPAPQL